METENVTSPAGEVAQGGVAPEAQPVERDEPRDDNERAAAANAKAAGDAVDDVATETDADGQEIAAEEFELDVGGNKHKFPKGTPIEAALEIVQQYQKGLEGSLQKKSQEVAAQQKRAEFAEKVAMRLQTLGYEKAADIARGSELINFTAQYETPQGQQYLNELWRSQPDQARQLSDQLAAARREAQVIESRLAQYGQHLNEAERQQVEVRAREGEAVVAKAVKGWSPQVESAVVDYAIKTYGIGETDAKNWRLNPVATVAMWKAMEFDKLQAKARAATKPAPTPPPAAPITAPKGQRAASATVDPSKMSMDEYVAWMEKREGRHK
jgi:hypothetical protein